MDDQRPQVLNSNTEKNATLQLLYFSNGLAPDRNHTVILQNDPVSDNTSSATFSINYAEVYYTNRSVIQASSRGFSTKRCSR